MNRVINDARKRTPDLYELRGLNFMLRKGDSSVADAERFVDSASKLMNLEGETGKTYVEIVKDFEERMKRIEDLEARAKSVQGERLSWKAKYTKQRRNNP